MTKLKIPDRPLADSQSKTQIKETGMIDASTLSKVLVDCRLIGLQAKEVGTVMGLLMKHEVINELTFREGIMLAAAELPDEDSPDPSASPDSP